MLYANEQVVTMMLALFAVGVGLGSMLAERLLHGEVSARYVPVSALAMAIFAIDLHLASTGRASTGALANIPTFLAQSGSWRILIDLVGLAVAGGLFTVPLYAILQHESEPAHRARVISANNIINALAMSVAAVGAAAFLARGMSMGQLFGLCGMATLPVALISAWIVRRALAKSLMRLVLRLLYRVEIEGLEHARAAMPRAVIAANHASFLDGLLLGAFLPGDPIFAVDTSDREAVVGAAVSGLRQRSSRRSDQPAVDSGNDSRGRGRLGLHHLPRGPHHHDRLPDEDLRRPGRHRRADQGPAAADSH